MALARSRATASRTTPMVLPQAMMPMSASPSPSTSTGATSFTTFLSLPKRLACIASWLAEL